MKQDEYEKVCELQKDLAEKVGLSAGLDNRDAQHTLMIVFELALLRHTLEGIQFSLDSAVTVMKNR